MRLKGLFKQRLENISLMTFERICPKIMDEHEA